MCKIKLSAKGYESSEQFLNTLILNYQKMPFTENDISVVCRKGGDADTNDVGGDIKIALRNLGRRGLVYKVGDNYYVQSRFRRACRIKLANREE